MKSRKHRGRLVAKKKPLSCPHSADGLLPGEEADIRREVANVVRDADDWLSQPNDQLGGQKPGDLVGTDREQHVRDLLRAIKHGMPV